MDTIVIYDISILVLLLIGGFVGYAIVGIIFCYVMIKLGFDEQTSVDVSITLIRRIFFLIMVCIVVLSFIDISNWRIL